MTTKLKTRKTKITTASQCFLDGASMQIIRQIVGRIHVATPTAEVFEAVKSKMAQGAWEDLTKEQQDEVERFITLTHEENRKQYFAVMSGRL